MRTISQPLLTFLLNSCWQIALIATVAAFCARLLRGTSARYQHLLWVSVLAFSLGLQILTFSTFSDGAFFSEPWRTIVKPANDGFSLATQQIPETQATSPTAPPAAMQTALEEAVPPIFINMNVAAVVVVLYLLFLLYRSGKLFTAWRKARRLKL